MQEARQKLSIVILTWNSLELLKRCLQSIRKNTSLLRYDITIVDNASSDGTVDYLRCVGGEYHVILNDRNKGVAAGRNQGIDVSGGQYIMILDVDTVVTDGAIDRLVEYMDGAPDCGLVAPRLTDMEGNLQLTCRKFPTLISKLLRRVPGRWAQNRLSREEMRGWDHASVREVDYVIGACQMIRRSVLQNIGPLDENIFYGPEDIDYCLRVWQGGCKVVYCPDAVIIHDEQRITRKKLLSRISSSTGTCCRGSLSTGPYRAAWIERT
jgi:GT2 family glycosyltransferase